MIRKSITILIIFLLTLGPVGPRVALAEETGGEEVIETQETEETDSSSETAEETTPESTEVEIEDQAEVTNEVDSEAITGENTIEEPTPSPTPSIPVELEGEEEEGEEGKGEELIEPECLDCQSVCESDCEEEETADQVEPPADSNNSEAEAEIETGDAVSVVEVENSVNTTEANSQTIYHTLNIFVPQGSNIDLSTTSLAVAETVFGQNNNLEPVVNVAVIDNQNFAFLSNDIVSLANSGENSIEGAEEAMINTGDACSVVTLLNKVNTTIIDSTIHLVTINIFGGVEGHILLPEFSSQSGDGCCGEVTQIGNQAVVENDVDSLAISGQNSITSEGEAMIETGEAVSTVSLVNIVNTSLIDATFYYLYINTFGTWTGDFLGWDNFGYLEGGESLSLNSINANGNGDCPGCYDHVLLENNAQVINHVSSTANTGGNSINGNQAEITTGNAYSSVSIINFINSSIVNSLGFFGFINIFGFLDGDIGGASLFAPPEPGVETTSSPEESGPFIREEGGLIEVELEHNVGTHVLPGDTITFFVKVRNPGTARLYDVHLWLGLVKDGTNMGGGTFKIGDIEAGKGFKVSTGLVLSQEAEPGEYLAVAEAWGLVGPGDTEISNSDEKSFLIGGFSPLPELPGLVEEVEAAEGEEVLGETTPDGFDREEVFKWLAFFLPMTYIASMGIRKRKELITLLSSFLA